MSWVALDGTITPRDQATVSVLDRGFLYGDSIFETLRTYRGKLFRLREHMQRFVRSVEVTKIPLPIPVDELEREIERLTREALELGRVDDAGIEIVVRVMVTRGEGPLGLLPTSTSPGRRVAYLMPATTPPESAYEKGAGVLLFPTYRPSDAARGAKVGNYLESMLGVMRAKESGLDEALIVNAAGNVLEGTTSNVFIVRGSKLVTPPITSGPLAGITRAVTLELARNGGIEVEESSLTPRDLLNADEAFITSTLREIMPIGTIQGTEGHRELVPGPITRRLREAFHAHVRDL